MKVYGIKFSSLKRFVLLRCGIKIVFRKKVHQGSAFDMSRFEFEQSNVIEKRVYRFVYEILFVRSFCIGRCTGSSVIQTGFEELPPFFKIMTLHWSDLDWHWKQLVISNGVISIGWRWILAGNFDEKRLFKIDIIGSCFGHGFIASDS